jgi:hypothetical protein
MTLRTTQAMSANVPFQDGVDQQPVIEISSPHRPMRKGEMSAESSTLRHRHRRELPPGAE